MDFGRKPEDDLNGVDFSLSLEPSFNKTILKGKPVKSPKAYIGCAKWRRTEWVGKIYPPKAKEKILLPMNFSGVLLHLIKPKFIAEQKILFD